MGWGYCEKASSERWWTGRGDAQDRSLAAVKSRIALREEMSVVNSIVGARERASERSRRSTSGSSSDGDGATTRIDPKRGNQHRHTDSQTRDARSPCATAAALPARAGGRAAPQAREGR